MSAKADDLFNQLAAEFTATGVHDREGFLDCARYNDQGDEEELRQYLTLHPADVNAQDEQGRTAVHMAAANGHMPILEMLFGFNPRPDVANFEGNTALHFAALNNRVDAARRLIEKGWNVTATNAFQQTPIQVIREKEFEDMETLLIEHDASLDNYEMPDGSAIHVEVTEDYTEDAKPTATRSSGPTAAARAPAKPARVDNTTSNEMLGSADVDGIE